MTIATVPVLIFMRIIRVGKNDAGQRLDKFLSKAVKGLPMSMMYKSIRTKKIKVNKYCRSVLYIVRQLAVILNR